MKNKSTFQHFNTLWVLFFVVSSSCFAQEPLKNFGNLKLLENAEIGFHGDLINDGTFDENSGLAGFFNEESALTISGAFRPIFNDMQVMVDEGLFLEVGVGVTNNLNFIVGDIKADKTMSDNHIDFVSSAFYNGQSNTEKIDGYVMITNKVNYTFPTGDGDQLKPLQLLSDDINPSAKCVYFYESPTKPNTIPGSYPLGDRAEDLSAISPFEFWRLEASVESRVRLFFNEQSNLASFVNDLKNLRVVGWHIGENKWHDLGASMQDGNLGWGSITSDSFEPQEYDAITFGASKKALDLEAYHYLVTPNNDNANDVLEIETVALSPDNNSLQIFNRWGALVYESENYKNDFDGTANVELVVDRDKKLSSGVYFYILKLYDVDVIQNGYLYLIN